MNTKVKSKAGGKEAEAKVPTDLRTTLAATPKVLALWQSLTPIARRDWISWIDSAKQAETRTRRIEQTASKLISGKRRPCCYALVPMNLYKALGASPKAKAQWKTLTPTERRDFIGWIDVAKESEAHKIRIAKVCALLSAGKRHF
ncbi:MAG: YdeI/OmpD-associated family protein [Patescibacteria group bacterium]